MDSDNIIKSLSPEDIQKELVKDLKHVSSGEGCLKKFEEIIQNPTELLAFDFDLLFRDFREECPNLSTLLDNLTSDGLTPSS